MKELAVLPRSIPFVDALFQLVEGKAPHEPADEILQRAERKHGLRIRADFEETTEEQWQGHVVDEETMMDALRKTFTVSDVQQPPELDEADWKRRREESHELEVRQSKEDESRFRRSLSDRARAKIQHEEELVEQRLYPFMSETSFIVTGENFSNDHDILFDDGTVLSYSWRSWAALVADWASRTAWLTPIWYDGTVFKWDYMDFYMDQWLNQLIDQWDQWYDALLWVLQIKCRRPGHQTRC
ncbi:MAG: hypothetical protein ACYSVY_05210 [Planctomycetota bacterium]|jgi:hypothetical protein